MAGASLGRTHEQVNAGAFLPGLPREGEGVLPNPPQQIAVTPVRAPTPCIPPAQCSPTLLLSPATPMKNGQQQVKAAPPSPAPTTASSTSSRSMYADGTYWKLLCRKLECMILIQAAQCKLVGSS